MGSPEAQSPFGDVQRISIFPALSWNGLHGSGQPPPFPLCAPGSSLWYNARAALWQGLKTLGLKPGQRVLVPAYTCGSEIDVMLAFGLELDWYPITPALGVDLDQLESAYQDGTRALFIIHYFGFPQPLDDILSFTRRHGLLLIEDTAHGLFSCDAIGRPLGSRGDASIFSLYKTLPVPDGGVLVAKAALGETSPMTGKKPALRSRMGQMKLLLERSAGHRFPATTNTFKRYLSEPLTRVLKSSTAGEQSAAGSESSAAAAAQRHTFDLRRGDWEMSGVARWVLDRLPKDTIAHRRRANYLRFESRLVSGPRTRPLFSSLPEGCCPLMFPLLQLEGGRAMRSWLTRIGIECHGFGFDNASIPMERFRLEAELKAQVACLPIHQDLDESQIDYMANAVNRWNRRAP